MLILQVNWNTFFKASPVQASSLPTNQKISVDRGSLFQLKSHKKRSLLLCTTCQGH